jgi:predicted phage-related endonuclease
LREKEKEEREKNKLKFIVEELERDVERLNKYIKSLDENLKNEYKKNQMGILDSDGSRREITSQLGKQRVEIETLRNIEMDQIKRQY